MIYSQLWNVDESNYNFIPPFMSIYMFGFFLKGEACWWTIHPASKQRSEGEKVRIGDDLILVSVSSERYLVRIILQYSASSNWASLCV